MKAFNIILCLILLTMISGCKSSKSTLPAMASDQYINESNDSATSLLSNFDSVASNYKGWNDVVVPINLSLLAPKEFSVSGRATMVKDECIFISIRVFGFEAANIYINNDSIFASYKLDKIYIAEDVKKLLNGYPATIGNLQNLLLGRAFILGKGEITAINNDFSLSINKDTWKIAPHCDIKDIEYQFIFDNKTNNLSMLDININKSKNVICAYAPYKCTPIGSISDAINISTILKDTPFRAMIEWNLDKSKWNSGATPKWKQPKGYKRVNASDLLKAI